MAVMVYSEAWENFFMKKTRSRKSRDTVPLRRLKILYADVKTQDIWIHCTSCTMYPYFLSFNVYRFTSICKHCTHFKITNFKHAIIHPKKYSKIINQY